MTENSKGRGASMTIADVMKLAEPCREARRRKDAEARVDAASDAYFDAVSDREVCQHKITQAIGKLSADDRALLVELYEPLRDWAYR